MEIEAQNLPIRFSADHSLLLKLHAPHFGRRYGYTVSFTEGDRVNKIKYETEVTYLKTLPNVARLFKIDRLTAIEINDAAPDLLADQLACETGKVFYPLIAEIDFTGKFIRISNLQEIQARWLKCKAEIASYFVGEETDKYLSLMDQAIADESHMNESMANDLFIHTYFAAIFKSYTAARCRNETTGFPLAGKSKPVQFKIREEVDGFLNEFQAIEIRHQGTADDDRSARDIEEEHFFPIHRINDPTIERVDGSYEALYILNKDTKAIESVVAKWKLTLQWPREVEVKIYEVDTEASMKALQSGEPAASALYYLDGQPATTQHESILERLKKILPWQKNT